MRDFHRISHLLQDKESEKNANSPYKNSAHSPASSVKARISSPVKNINFSVLSKEAKNALKSSAGRNIRRRDDQGWVFTGIESNKNQYQK